MNKSLNRAVLAGSLFLSALTGCSQETTCPVTSRDPDAIDVTSVEQASKICKASQEKVLKCVRIGDGYADTAEERDVNCSSPNIYHDLGELFYHTDVVYCKATSKPELVQIQCQEK